MTDITTGKSSIYSGSDSDARTGISRRTLVATALSAGIVASLPLVQGCSHSDWTDVGKTDLFPIGLPQRVVLADGTVIFVTRTSDTDASAVTAKCTHRGCEVAWHSDAKQLICPCHGAAFAADGKNIHGTRGNPAEVLPPLTSVSARVQQDAVQVSVKTST
jgi:Rieske Fe-S protein